MLCSFYGFYVIFTDILQEKEVIRDHIPVRHLDQGQDRTQGHAPDLLITHPEGQGHVITHHGAADIKIPRSN